MTTSDWITLILGLAGGGSVVTGGVKGVALLTRMAVAAEQAGPVLVKLGESLEALGKQVQDHETRLAVVESKGAATPH